jgi:hypothetical protein
VNKPILYTTENDARFVISYFYSDQYDNWTVNIFDGETEKNMDHSDPERLWCERWASNYLTLLLGPK